MIHLTSGTQGQSVGKLVKVLADESRTLFRQEIDLAKTEMSEKLSRYARNAVYLVVGSVIACAGLFALIAAACVGAAVGLASLMDPDIAAWLGPLGVGVIILLIGYAFVQTAINTFRRENLTPRKTIDSMRENTEWFKEQMTTSSRT